MSEIIDEYMVQLQEKLPVVIVVEPYRYDKNIDAFINNNNFTFVWGGQNGKFENGKITIFHRGKQMID